MLICLVGTAFSETPVRFYVVTNGVDSNPGTADQPFATLNAARAAIRKLKAKGGLPVGGVIVEVSGGLYVLKQGFALEQQDSGEPEKPIVYQANLGEKVRLFGGNQLQVSEFTPVTDSDVLSRMDPAARGHILQLVFTERQGAKPDKYPDIFDNGGGLFRLLQDDHVMPLSRWPKRGYAPISEVLDSGMLPGHQASFVSKAAPIARWQAAATDGSLWIAGFWRVPWVIQAVRVQSIDPITATITLAKNVTGGIGSKYSAVVNGTRKGNGKEPYYAMNLVEELTTPGEWCYRFANNTLYYWPATQSNSAEILISNLKDPVVDFKNVSNVTLQGFQFEGGLDDTIRITGGRADRVAGCEFHNTGGIGVDIVSGTEHGVQSCDFEHIGDTAIQMDSGNLVTLEPGKLFAENNHIHDIGEVTKVVPAIALSGVGNRVSHNLIHDVPNAGVRYSGNDQLMEFNEIHNVGLDSGDLGGFYTNGDWAAQGNMIRYNLVHNAADANASYIDDGGSGRSVIGNIFYKCASGLFVGGGHNNIMQNNIIVECERGVHLDNRGLSRGYDQTSKGLAGRLSGIDPKSPPWSIKYPGFLDTILKAPKLPTGNVLENNIVVRCKKPWDISMPELTDTKLNITDTTLFPDAAHLKFDLPADGSILKRLPNFKTIPVNQIGLYIDNYRKSLPTAEETGRYETRAPAQLFDSVTDMKRSNEIGK